MRTWVTLIFGVVLFAVVVWAMFFRSGSRSSFNYGNISSAQEDAARISVSGLSSGDRFAARTAAVMIVDMTAAQGHECAYLDTIANDASDSRLTPEPQSGANSFDHATFNTDVLKFATIENEFVDALPRPVDGIDLNDADYQTKYDECLFFIDRAVKIYGRVLEANF